MAGPTSHFFVSLGADQQDAGNTKPPGKQRSALLSHATWQADSMNLNVTDPLPAFERREAQREKDRKEQFTRRGVHHERSGIPEKMYDNRRVELPANSRYELPNGYENGERSTNMKMGSAGARVNRAGWVEMEMDVLGAPRR
ncbi:hypothetical protein BDV30DRAFT_231879 [Aspergillus minisclerotigenes]|uniref:Uncharacterized protein n=1 Tax=Aspergillus minisclerotigenes TaxID=656917 RepID=A0A5N6IK21_9EURO|nr:hypothetical protein BDV30DRAFT_231879 [Aspergillus minisclerotigenes]